MVYFLWEGNNWTAGERMGQVEKGGEMISLEEFSLGDREVERYRRSVEI